MPTHLTYYLVALTLTASAGLHAADWYAHNGKIVDAATNMALRDATATAASSNQRIPTDDDCPKYEGFIDDDVSKSDGTFTLRIPTGNTSYIVTYCRNNYEAFTPPANDNIEGAPVTPRPVHLWAHAGTDTDMYAALINVQRATKATTISLATNQAVFAAAVKTLPSAEQALINEWIPTLEPTDTPSPEAVARAAASLAQVTSSLQTALTYFAKASPSHFRTQVIRVDDLNDYTRNREITPRERPQQVPRAQPSPPQQAPAEVPATSCAGLPLPQVIDRARQEARESPRAALACFRPYFRSTAFQNSSVVVQERFLFEYFRAVWRATATQEGRNLPQKLYMDETARIVKFYVEWYPSREEVLPPESRRITAVILQLGGEHAKREEWATLVDAYSDIAREHPRYLSEPKALVMWHSALRNESRYKYRSRAQMRARVRADGRYRDDWCLFLHTVTSLSDRHDYPDSVQRALSEAREVLDGAPCDTRWPQNNDMP